MEFESLWSAARPILAAHALRMAAGNYDDAEDLLQAAAVKAFRFYDQFDPNQNFNGWAFRILQRCQIEAIRLRERRPATIGFEDYGEYSELDPADPEELADMQFGWNEQVERAIAMTMRLPRSRRKMIASFALYDMDYQQIASELGLSRKAVCSRFFEIRSRVRHLNLN